MNTRKDNQLENLDETVRTWILETAPFTNLIEMVTNLRKRGVMTSVPTLSRFVRRHQEKMLLAEREEMKEAVDRLSEGGKEGRLREGSLEAVRQRLYERVLSSREPEEARLLYAALVKEEMRLKELELEARKIALAEEELKVKAALALEGGGRRKKAEIVDAAELKNSRGGAEARRELAEGGAGGGEMKQLAAPLESEKRLKEVLGRALEVLNRGGALEERMLEARGLLAEGVKSLEINTEVSISSEKG
jgi:hypothetical protein